MKKIKKSLLIIIIVLLVMQNLSLVSFASEGSITETESNNTYNTADITYNDYDNYGVLNSSNDVDWWKITFDYGGYVNFWLGQIPAYCNYSMLVYKSDGTTLLCSSNNAGNMDELCQYQQVSAGTYYILILSVNGGSSSQYKMRVRKYDIIGSDEVYRIYNVGASKYLTVRRGYNANYQYSVYLDSLSCVNGYDRRGNLFKIKYNQITDSYRIAPTCSYNGYYRVLDLWNGLSLHNYSFTYPSNDNAEKQLIFELQSDGSYIISFKSNRNLVLDYNPGIDVRYGNNVYTSAGETQLTGNVYVNARSSSSFTQKWRLLKHNAYNTAESLYKAMNWVWPIQCTNLSSSYGYRYYGGDAFHDGIDIPTNGMVESVSAPTDASVVEIKCCDANGARGKYIILETDNLAYNWTNDNNVGSITGSNLKIIFQHLSSFCSGINVNTNVTRGQEIVISGDSGSLGSFHLHFTVITDGSNAGYHSVFDTVNPLMFYDSSEITNFN